MPRRMSLDHPRPIDEFLTALIAMDTPAKRRQLLAAFLSDRELEKLAKRWVLIKLLQQGKNQREVYDRTGVARATVGRAAKAMRDHSRILKEITNKTK